MEAVFFISIQLLDHGLALRNLSRHDLLPGIINTNKYEVLLPLEDSTAHLWKIAITKAYKDIIAEPREKKNGGERRLSVLERRNSIASSLRSSGLRRRTRSVGVPRGVQERMEDRVEGSSMVGRSRQRAVKVTQRYISSVGTYCLAGCCVAGGELSGLLEECSAVWGGAFQDMPHCLSEGCPAGQSYKHEDE